jgi:hypothetical protein
MTTPEPTMIQDQPSGPSAESLFVVDLGHYSEGPFSTADLRDRLHQGKVRGGDVIIERGTGRRLTVLELIPEADHISRERANASERIRASPVVARAPAIVVQQGVSPRLVQALAITGILVGVLLMGLAWMDSTPDAPIVEHPFTGLDVRCTTKFPGGLRFAFTADTVTLGMGNHESTSAFVIERPTDRDLRFMLASPHDELGSWFQFSFQGPVVEVTGERAGFTGSFPTAVITNAH